MTIDIRDGLLQIFNVDHGACALLTMPSPQGVKRVLIDCGHATDLGGDPWFPGDHLRRIGVGHIDLLICTNYDEDHASGVPSLLQNNVSVGCILGNPTVPPEVIEHLKSEDGMGNGIRLLANSLAGRRGTAEIQTPPTIPGVELRWFYNQWPYWDTENNLSLVAHLNVWNTRFLFPGDLERDGCENMLKLPSFSALMPGIHVLIAAHHGRENGRCPAMFDDYACSPQLVIISDCAKRHQSQETVPYYYRKARGVPNIRGQNTRYVMTTRNDGEIVFRWENGLCKLY
jgi:beta-lactamase superfamily II metal-dependent hydrolase